MAKKKEISENIEEKQNVRKNKTQTKKKASGNYDAFLESQPEKIIHVPNPAKSADIGIEAKGAYIKKPSFLHVIRLISSQQESMFFGKLTELKSLDNNFAFAPDPVNVLYSYVLFLLSLPNKAGAIMSPPGQFKLDKITPEQMKSDIICLFDAALCRFLFPETFQSFENKSLHNDMIVIDRMLFVLAGRPLFDNLAFSTIYSRLLTEAVIKNKVMKTFEKYKETVLI